jgi:hypothetical protein
MTAPDLEAITPLQRIIVERAQALARGLETSADSAPDAQAIDRCESLLLGAGREFLRAALEDTPQARIDALEKEGRPGGPAPAAPRAATRGDRRVRG